MRITKVQSLVPLAEKRELFCNTYNVQNYTESIREQSEDFVVRS